MSIYQTKDEEPRDETQALVVGSASTPAGGFRKLHLQMYETGMPQPGFSLSVVPHPRELVSWSVARIDSDDHYERTMSL